MRVIARDDPGRSGRDHRARARRAFLAIAEPRQAVALLCDEADLALLSLPPAAPGTGDRVAIVAAHGPAFVRDSAFIGVGAARERAGRVTLRRRVAAPEGHAIPLTVLLVRLRSTRGLTHARLGSLVGSLVDVPAADVAAVESALLDVAKRYGPKARRPAHRVPRTPGRRALLKGRVAARGGYW